VTGEPFVSQSRTIRDEGLASFAVLTCAVGLMRFDPERTVALRRVLNQDGRMVLRMNVEVVCRRDPVPSS
jgi:hypothetical protein